MANPLDKLEGGYANPLDKLEGGGASPLDKLEDDGPGIIMRQLEGIGNAYEAGQSTAEQKLATPGEAPGAFVNALAPTSTGYYQQAGDLFGRGDILSSIGKAGKGLAWNVLEAASVPHAVLTKGLTAAAEGIVGGPKTAGETFVEAIPSFYSPVKAVLDKTIGPSETRDKWGYRAALIPDIFLDPANAAKIGRLTPKGAISETIRTAQKAGKLDSAGFRLVKEAMEEGGDILPREKITKMMKTAGGEEVYASSPKEVLTFLRDRAGDAKARKRLTKLIQDAEKLEAAGESIPILPTEMMNERALRSYGMVEDALAIPGASVAIPEKTYKKYLGGGNPFKWGGSFKDKSGTQFGVMSHMQATGHSQDVVAPYQKADDELKKVSGFSEWWKKATPQDRMQADKASRDYLGARSTKEVPLTARFEPGDAALDDMVEPPMPALPAPVASYLKGARKLKERMETDAITRGEHVMLRPLFNEAFEERLTDWAKMEAQKAKNLKAQLMKDGLNAEEIADELAQTGMSTSPMDHIKNTVWDRVEAYGSPEKYIASNTWLDHPAFDTATLSRKATESRGELAKMLEEIQKIKSGVDERLVKYREAATSKQIADKAYGAGKGYVRGQNLIEQSRGVAQEGAKVFDETAAEAATVAAKIDESGKKLSALLADPTIPMKDKIDAAAAEVDKATGDFIISRGKMFDKDGRLAGAEDGPSNIYNTRWANPHERDFARAAKSGELAQLEKDWAKGQADHLSDFVEKYKHGRGPAEKTIIFRQDRLPDLDGTMEIATSRNIKGINTDTPDWYSIPELKGKRKAAIISTLRKMESGDLKGMSKAERNIYDVLVDVRHEDLAHGHISGNAGLGTVQNDAYREALIEHVIKQEAQPLVDALGRRSAVVGRATQRGEKQAAATAGDMMRWGDMRRRLDAKAGDLMNAARGMREKGRTGMAEGEIGHFQARSEPGKVEVRKLVEEVAQFRKQINELKKAAAKAERRATRYEQGAAGLDEMRTSLYDAGGGLFKPESVQRHVRRAVSQDFRQKYSAWKEIVGGNYSEDEKAAMDILDEYAKSQQFNPSNTLSLGVKARTDEGKIRTFSEMDDLLKKYLGDKERIANIIADGRIAGGEKMKRAESLGEMMESAGLFDRDLFNLVGKSISQHGRRAYTNHLLQSAKNLPREYVREIKGAIPHGFVPMSEVFAGAGDDVKGLMVNKDFAKYLNHANSYVARPEGMIGKVWSVASDVNNWQRKTMLGWPSTLLRNTLDAVSKTLLFHGPTNTYHGMRAASTVMADHLDEIVSGVADLPGMQKFVRPFLDKTRQWAGGRGGNIVTKSGLELSTDEIHKLARKHGVYLGGNSYALDTAKGLFPVKEGESALKKGALAIPRKLGNIQGGIIDTSGAVETFNRLAAFIAELIEGADPALAASRAHGMHWTGAMPDELISMLPEGMSGTARAVIKDTITFFNFQRRNVPFWWKKVFSEPGRASAPVKLRTDMAASAGVEPIPAEMNPYLTEQQAKSPFAIGHGVDRRGDPAIKTVDLGSTLSQLDAMNVANLDVMSQAVPLLQLAGVGQQMAKSVGDPAGMHAAHPYFGTDMRGGDLARYVAGQVLPPVNKFSRFAEATGLTNTDRYPEETPLDALMQTMVYPFRTKEIGIGGIEHRVGKEWNPKINALEDQIDIAYSRGDTKEAERLQAMLDEATFGEEDAMQAVMDYMNRNTQRGSR